MNQIYKYIMDNIISGKIEKQTAVSMLAMLKNEELKAADDIAVIGLAARFPYADSIEAYWENIRNGIDGIHAFPDARIADIQEYVNGYINVTGREMGYLPGGYFEDISLFDYQLFKLSPKEASLMDPTQRVFLQTAWHTIEDAGYGGNRLKGTRTGLYLGCSANADYHNMIFSMEPESLPLAMTGNISAMIPSRIAHILDLKGPTMLLDTACSSSAVSVHLACQALKNGDCDMAIAGGIRINMLPVDHPDIKMGVEAADGCTRTFDDGAGGAGWGEGSAGVFLKPLSRAKKDGDHIYAVIKGSAVNQDGAAISLTAPNPQAQAEVILKAWENAGISPDTLGYIEAHGTATSLGDPLEITGLQKAFGKHTQKRQFCAISAVKTNVGHLYECAGMAALIKAVLSLKHAEIPKGIHFTRPNREILFTNSPVYVNTRTRKWETDGTPRRCGVSAFGLSGTNCHIVLEEAPTVCRGSAEGVGILALSAAGRDALLRLMSAYIHFLRGGGDVDIASLCYTANTGRGHYGHRVILSGESQESLAENILLALEAMRSQDSGQTAYAMWGAHRVISRNRDGRRIGDITEQEKAELSSHLAQKLDEYAAKKSESLLDEICGLYVKGADAVWERLYANAPPQKTRVPLYPFEESRCWFAGGSRAEEVSSGLKDSGLYEMIWHEEPAEPGERKKGGALIFSSAWTGAFSGLKEQLADLLKGRTVITVQRGESFEELSPQLYTVSSCEADYQELMSRVREKGIEQIIHMMTVEERTEIETIKDLTAVQEAGVYSLFYLARALTEADLPMEIVLVSSLAGEVSGAETRLHPENAPMLGMGKVLRKEYEGLTVRCIDIDDLTGARDLAEEIVNGGEEYAAVAYRNGKRYAEMFAPLDVDAREKTPVTLVRDGVYLILGGAGDIGLTMDRSMADRERVQLVFINRKPFPGRGEWEGLLRADEERKLCQKIEAVRQIEAGGSKVYNLSADISDPGAMEAAIDLVRKEYGSIKGIVHSAGVSRDDFLKNRNPEAFAEILDPKIAGTWLIDRLTRADNPDFMILFSSVASIFSAATQADYVAANAYMDAYASFRNRKGLKTAAINWTTWKDIGMAAQSGHAIDTIFKTLKTEDGTAGFWTVLGAAISRALVGTINIEGVGLYLLERSNVRLSDGIREYLAGYKAKHKSKPRSTKGSEGGSAGEVRLLGKENGQYTAAEREIAGICKELLGFDEIDVYDNFFEMGVDSILLMRIQTEVEKQFPGKVSVVDMFEYSTISRLAQFIADKDAGEGAPVSSRGSGRSTAPAEGIAIIGMAVKLPEADHVEAFWDNIINKVDCEGAFPRERRGDVESLLDFKGISLNSIDYSPGVYLDEIDKFDYGFFKISPKEAGYTDPQHRLFLQTAWHALEDAGYGGRRITGSQTGVYVGFSPTGTYMRLINEVDPLATAAALVGNTTAVASGRLSYLLDLKGPNVVLDTACSSSLVAIHTACRAIRSGECEMAVAGGIRLNMFPVFQKGERTGIGMESSDGKTRTFDHSSDGTGAGEGIAAVVLKPYGKAVEDGDHIYAKIKGSALNQDGSSAGITAPNPVAQEEVLRLAWEDADVEPESISYIEAHGTGTQLGDTIEIKAIQNAFQRYTDKKQFCAIGSVKTNIGHLSETAGIAGLIKAALCLEHGMIPPQVHFTRPNAKIDFAGSPVFINTRLRKWDTAGAPRRAGVSGFGMSGTNCHIVLEEAGRPEATEEAAPTPPYQLLALSGKNEVALLDLAGAYVSWLNRAPEMSLESVCYAAATGRGHYPLRLAVLAEGTGDLRAKIAMAVQANLEIDEGWFFRTKAEAPDAHRTEGDTTVAAVADRGELFTPEALSRLAESYVSGADVNWTQLYAGRRINKIRLPLYPFQRTRCWVDVPEIIADSTVAPEGMYFGGVWIREALKEERAGILGGNSVVVVCKDAFGYADTLAASYRASGTDVWEVSWGEGYQKTGEKSYVVSGTEEDYRQLFRQSRDKRIVQIVNLFSYGKTDPPGSLEELGDRQRHGVYSLLNMTKGILSAGIKKSVDVVLVADHVNEVTAAEECVKPENAALFGLAKVIRQEYPQMLCRCVDVDHGTPAEALYGELLARTETYQVAYRSGVRYVEEIREIDLNYSYIHESNIEIRADGVYLVTGGLGGIGLEIAKHLSSGNKVKIALVSRAQMPERDLWETILKADEDKKCVHRIQTIRGMEANGSEVLTFSADVSDYESMKRVTDRLTELYGAIHGVIHAAGVAGDGFLFKKDLATFNNVFEPKTKGTWILDELTKDQELDFFVLFSSVAAIFNGPGEGDYAAANSYLDAYSYYRNKKGKKTHTINWVAWKETGMAVDYGVNFDGLFKVLPTQKAIRAFSEVLNRDIAQVVVGEMNYGTENLLQLDKVPIRLSYKIRAAVEFAKQKFGVYESVGGKRAMVEVKLLGAEESQQYNEIYGMLAGIYSSVLGFGEINIHDSFFELGGDSILLSQLHQMIEEEYPGKVSLMELFEYTSIYKLSRYLSGESEEQAKDTDQMEQEELEDEMGKLYHQMKDGALDLDEMLESINQL